MTTKRTRYSIIIGQKSTRYKRRTRYFTKTDLKRYDFDSMRADGYIFKRLKGRR